MKRVNLDQSDARTLGAYDRSAAEFAKDWHEQPAPADLHAILLEYFKPGRTADIGCGSGRDTAWLQENGFSPVGYDASAGLLAEARRRYPHLQFEQAALPELDGIGKDRFANVLCETVIMHLEPEVIGPSVQRLIAILEPRGVLYLSWRVTAGASLRDGQERLYAAFDTAIVLNALCGSVILLDEERVSLSSNKTIHRIVARKAESS